ncbi:hypothetical protein GC177_07155 [bacterium]|nr:hypothetical protein [bacterium]
MPGLDALADGRVDDAALTYVADHFYANVVEGAFYRHVLHLVEPVTEAGLNFSTALHILEHFLPEEQAEAVTGLFHDRLLRHAHEQFMDHAPSRNILPPAFKRAPDGVIQAVCQDLSRCDAIDTGHLPPLPEDRGMIWNTAMLLNSLVLDAQKGA